MLFITSSSSTFYPSQTSHLLKILLPPQIPHFRPLDVEIHILRLLRVRLDLLLHDGVESAEDPRREQRSVGAIIDTDRGHRHAPGHLHDTVQAIHAIQRAPLHRHPDDGKGRVRRRHAWEVCGSAGGRDDDLDPPRGGRRGVLRHVLRRAVRGRDLDLGLDPKVLEDLEAGDERLQIAV